MQPGQPHSTLTRGLFITLLTAAAISTFLLLPSQAAASPLSQTTSTPSPQPTPTFDPARLEKPKVSEIPNQLGEGSLIYWGVCMACHGDRGQGLTDEWRMGAYGEENNCWVSGCHNAHHPDWGFEIPRDKPISALAGTGKLARFTNAQQMKDYIITTMPWWDPGSLTEEKAWQVTAYILKLNNAMPEGIELNSTNASAIPIHSPVTAPGDQKPAMIFLAIVIVLATAGWVTQDILSRKRSAPLSDGRSIPRVIERPNFFHHIHPPTIPAAQARLSYTLGAGGLAVFFSLILLVTGILEMFYYIPTIERAAISIETITYLIPFGGLIRNLHFWSAQALVIVMFVHLLRIVLTGAYARHRRLNYLIGLGMLVLILLLDFTGYVLRFDEGIRWALVVGTNLLKTIPFIGDTIYQLVVGGTRPGTSSVVRFYTWHIFVLTLGMIILGVWHIFRTRRDGGIAIPPPAMRKESQRITRFQLVRREVSIMLIAGSILLFMSAVLPAPIQPPITQITSASGDAHAPWFFLWTQQLLKLGDPFVLGILVPLFALALMAILPYVLPEASDSELGRWFPRGNRIAQIITLILTLAFLVLTILAKTPTPQP